MGRNEKWLKINEKFTVLSSTFKLVTSDVSAISISSCPGRFNSNAARDVIYKLETFKEKLNRKTSKKSSLLTMQA